MARTTKERLLFVAKFVAYAPNGQDHLGVFRVLFDFGSQPVDVWINGPIVAFVRIIPDFFQQVFAGENPARVSGEQAQQIKLFRS